MAHVTDIKVTPSGVYAIARRGADQFDVLLSSRSPQWQAIGSGSYIDCDPAEWRRLISESRAMLDVTSTA